MTRERETAPEFLLERALGFLTPDAADEARVLAAVQRELASDLGTPPAVRESAPVTRVVPRTLAGKLVMVAAITGALGFAAGFFVGRESSLGAREAVQQAIVAAPASPVLSLEARDAVVMQRPEARAPEAAPPSVAPPREGSARATPARARHATPRASTPSARATSLRAASPLDLRQALVVLRAAQSAQREGRAGAALERLTELDQRAAADMLSEERLVTRVLVLCDLNDVDAARRLARELRVANASSIYQGRLRQSCAGE